MTTHHTSQDQTTDHAHGAHTHSGLAAVAYLIFFVPLLTNAKDDPFVKFHVKQGLVLFIVWAGTWFLGVLPFLWPIIYLVQLAVFVLAIIGILNAVHGKQKELPVIGRFAQHFSF